MRYDYTIACAAGGALATAASAMIKQRIDYTDLAIFGGIVAIGYCVDRKKKLKDKVLNFL